MNALIGLGRSEEILWLNRGREAQDRSRFRLDQGTQQNLSHPFQKLQGRLPRHDRKADFHHQGRKVDPAARQPLDRVVEAGNGPRSHWPCMRSGSGLIEVELQERIAKLVQIKTRAVPDEDACGARIDVDVHDFRMVDQLPAQIVKEPRVMPPTGDFDPNAAHRAMDDIGALSLLHR
jgi:hypothetical protein